MTKEFLKYFLILIPVVAVQLLVIPFIRIQTAVPDLVTLLVIIFAIRHGQINGMIFGFITGFIFDSVSGGTIGSSMFAKTIAAFISGYLYIEHETSKSRNILQVFLIVFACSFFDSLFYSLFGSLELKVALTHLVIYQAFLPGFYTTMISIPILLSMQKRDEL